MTGTTPPTGTSSHPTTRGAYRERPTAVPGVVLWQRRVESADTTTRILPDGCLDLLWDGERLVVAGPDSRAREHCSPVGASYVAVRCHGGTGPALLGVPADELRDSSPDLADLWEASRVRTLTERVAGDPVAALEAWVRECGVGGKVDPLGARVLAMATAGLPVAGMAAAVGLSPRQLHRRCLPLFGYGPKHLARVLRFGRALASARSGLPLARVAVDAGYADQAHLSRDVRDLAGTTPSTLLRELAG